MFRCEKRISVSASVVLICAVLASLAAGVLLAYGLCLAIFSAFRVHFRQVTSHKQAVLSGPASLG